eukprot:6817212-Prymnesium_polylepis.1
MVACPRADSDYLLCTNGGWIGGRRLRAVDVPKADVDLRGSVWRIGPRDDKGQLKLRRCGQGEHTGCG